MLKSSTRFSTSWLLPVAVVAGLSFSQLQSGRAVEKVEGVLEVAKVWAGHPVGFALLTCRSNQFAAFYDEQRRMTVAARVLPSTQWRFQRLPQTLGWDSHNFIRMAADARGFLHLSGNMHVHPLVYFRSRRPLDIESFQEIPSMIGDREKRCTYPNFFQGSAGELIFTYRDGSSGNGDQIYNVYEAESQTWKRLIDTPLTSGEGLMNAYLVGPVRGPDGYFHLCWVWRNTPDCSSNHDLSYARSQDLRHWEKSSGEALKLPITLTQAEIVDPVPPRGGIINGNTHVGFDSQRRPILSYHKFDSKGKTQLYNARLENGRWKVYQTSDWDYRWEFEGGGSISFDISFGPVVADGAGKLTQSFRHRQHGSGLWVLDGQTLKPVERLQPASPLGEAASDRETRPLGMQVGTCNDSGKSDEPAVRYLLRWETLPSNRDRPRPEPFPSPSTLKLYKLVNSTASSP